MGAIKKFIQFLKDVANDPVIPERDKKVLLAMIVLVVSPIDLIPDWIPIIGLLDDIIILALILDYFFEILDSDVLLKHYPFGMKSFVATRRLSRMITTLSPSFIRDHVWKYKPDIYKGK
ncbi:MAG: DUF1232 domain-containing protein [Bdellovibrionales bacterium]